VPDRPTGIRFRWTKNHIRVSTPPGLKNMPDTVITLNAHWASLWYWWQSSETGQVGNL